MNRSVACDWRGIGAIIPTHTCWREPRIRPTLRAASKPCSGAAVSDPILSHDRVVADGAEPRAWMFVLHGIYGAGRNWASVVRRVVRERPEWGALLVDLRQHG